MTASPRIYTRSLHDALPIWVRGLEQRHDVLRQLEEAHSSGREKLFAALAAAGVGEPSLLTDRLQPPAGWERSLDFYFAAMADAVVVPAGTDPLALAAALRAAQASAVLVVPAEGPALGGSSDLGEPLAAALGLPPEIATALPPAYLVEDEEQARG